MTIEQQIKNLETQLKWETCKNEIAVINDKLIKLRKKLKENDNINSINNSVYNPNSSSNIQTI